MFGVMCNGKWEMCDGKYEISQGHRTTRPQGTHTGIDKVRFLYPSAKKADASCTTTLYYVNLFKELFLNRRKLFSEFRPAHRLKQSYCVIGKASAKVRHFRYTPNFSKYFFIKSFIFPQNTTF